ncbi:hypothetical protein [Microbacterium sp. 77mftsu3.1]|uniref:hypothetical protein n=1 Tax=Microbacterium sp. 77mftsu3.1 TaxID=1761802 RepID=UPI0003794970|nr:hypothetical protein [Microbacterium sp. 77mftsu3.1]SDH33582.1 hypothetical protein SAMN04488590_3060 [Microbacterium sp. 77mftsu3.1]
MFTPTSELDPSLNADESFERTRISYDTSDAWPPEPTVITHTLAGELADRIRARLGAAPDDNVTMTETTTEGGYSSYTREIATDFTVTAGDRAETFYADSQADWREDIGRSFADSVFARFDAWLNAATRPEQLFADWFEFDEESGPVVCYRSKAETQLVRAAFMHRVHTHRLALTGVADGQGRVWELDFITDPQTADRTPKVIHRFRLGQVDGLTVNRDVQQHLLEKITGRLMSGRGR